MDDSNISSCDIDEWSEYLSEKYYILPITLFDDSIKHDISKTIVKRANPFGRRLPYENEYFEIEGIKITFEVPFDGESQLLYLRPSSRILRLFNVENLKTPHGDTCGGLFLCFEYTNQELQNHSEDMLNYVRKQFENEFTSYRTMIGNVNSEIDSFNESLRETALKFLKERKQKADVFAAISESLEIPLKQNEFAPNVTPIPLKRIVRQPKPMPSTKPLPNEYSIRDEDYENINKIIYLTGTTMEKTARSYYVNNEEELRDHLLASLNTHYDNATGETFRKLGKADIHIEFENKAAFIGECKVWHGEKAFADAVQQVINYTTWKDVKVSIIVFNKENKSFESIIKNINTWISNNTIKHKQTKPNLWTCDFADNDKNIVFKLTVLAFDLYVDKSQFADDRTH